MSLTLKIELYFLFGDFKCGPASEPLYSSDLNPLTDAIGP